MFQAKLVLNGHYAAFNYCPTICVSLECTKYLEQTNLSVFRAFELVIPNINTEILLEMELMKKMD